MNQPGFVPLPRGETLLSRETPSRRIGELEVLRTIAVSMVLLEHLSGNLIFWPSHFAEQLQQTGVWTGVDLFFAISGFVIARSLLPKLAEAQDVRSFVRQTVEFWLRRAWRLWPSAWFWLAAPPALCLAFNHSGVYGGFKENWEMAVAGVANLANFREAYVFMRAPPGTAFVQWSLSLEEQFYILLPFAAILLRRRLAYLMGGILVYTFLTSTPYSPLAMFTRGGSVAAGVLLALWSFHQSYQNCAPIFLGRVRLARLAALVGGIALLISLGATQLHVV
ncbi:MAG TPA: acyltransferase, partial [Acidocella sp.]|nr:acyltransferase [Acidocella sp.]